MNQQQMNLQQVCSEYINKVMCFAVWCMARPTCGDVLTPEESMAPCHVPCLYETKQRSVFYNKDIVLTPEESNLLSSILHTNGCHAGSARCAARCGSVI